MDVLSRERPKPLLPFAGTHRLVDFPLSNLANSGITEVWLSVQYLGQQLADALDNGKPWDLDRQHGGFKVLIPDQGRGSALEEGFVSGNAEQLLQDRELIRRFGADAVAVLSADHVYRLDLTEVVEQHLERRAECTIVTTEVERQEAVNHAVVTGEAAGRVTGFAYKPERPDSATVATEIFLYHPETLVQVLEELNRERAGDAEAGLGDFGEALLPALVERGRVFSYPLTGYWRDLGRPETYFAAHADLLASDPGLFTDPAWPIRTEPSPRPAARAHPGAVLTNSLLSPGCEVHGEVVDSVLGPGVVVESGATVRGCVLFDTVRVGPSAELAYAIIDSGVRIGAMARIGAVPERRRPRNEDLVLVGRDCLIRDAAALAPGARLEPGTVAT